MSEENKSIEEISMMKIILRLWQNRYFLLKCIGIAAAFGLCIAFSIPNKYSTNVKLVPEIDSNKKLLSGGVGALAAMAGFNTNMQASNDAISAELYPDVVQSIPFLVELFPLKVKTESCDTVMTFYDYMENYQQMPWWSYVLRSPFMLLNTVRNAFSSEEETQDTTVNVECLTKKQMKMILSLQKQICVTVDKKSSVMSVFVEMQDPQVSMDITKVVVDNLQKYIINYRTQKVKQDLEYTQTVYDEAKESYYKTQSAYATFEDENKNIISSKYKIEQERLKNEMTLAYSLYNTLAQKLEQDKIRVQEQTPVFVVIEPATKPVDASSPNKKIILIAFVFLGILVGGVYLLFKDRIISNFKVCVENKLKKDEVE